MFGAMGGSLANYQQRDTMRACGEQESRLNTSCFFVKDSNKRVKCNGVAFANTIIHPPIYLHTREISEPVQHYSAEIKKFVVAKRFVIFNNCKIIKNDCFLL